LIGIGEERGLSPFVDDIDFSGVCDPLSWPEGELLTNLETIGCCAGTGGCTGTSGF